MVCATSVMDSNHGALGSEECAGLQEDLLRGLRSARIVRDAIKEVVGQQLVHIRLGRTFPHLGPCSVSEEGAHRELWPGATVRKTACTPIRCICAFAEIDAVAPCSVGCWAADTSMSSRKPSRKR